MRPLSLLRLEPDAQLVFATGEEASERIERTLRIENASEDTTVAWKVRTTAPEAFLVCPRSGVAAPGEAIETLITLLPGPASASGVGGLRGGADARFEVRAAPVEAGRSRVERTEWGNFPRESQESAQLRAIVRSACSTNGAGSGRWRDSRVEAGVEAEVPSTGWRPERPRRSQFEDDPDRPPITSAWSSRELPSRVSGLSEPSLRRPPAQKSAPALLSEDASGEPGRRPPEEDDKPPQMGPMTKAVLGVLIVILVFNLYLRPLLEVALGTSPPSPENETPAGQGL